MGNSLIVIGQRRQAYKGLQVGKLLDLLGASLAEEVGDVKCILGLP